MIKMRVKELLDERGRSLYWLGKQTGIRYGTLLKMKRGKTSRLELSALENLCRALECEPGDLFILRPRLKRRDGSVTAVTTVTKERAKTAPKR